jgi:cytochrome c556
MNRLIRVGAAATLAAVSVLAYSQMGPQSPEAQAQSAVDARQAVFKLIANQNGPLGALRNAQAPFDAAVVARNAERIQMMAGMIPELFARDTREFKDLKTTALEGIWNAPADFKAKADALADAAGAVVAAAKSGDRAATAAAAAKIGPACGGCHDAFRAKPPGR